MDRAVVVLVDEYDLPTTEIYFDNEDKSKLNADIIQGFFGSLKRWSSYIHFGMTFGAIIRGINIQSMHNRLDDLTSKEEYSDMIGFTKEEILKSYTARLSQIVPNRTLDNTEVLFERVLIPYYNNYRFSTLGTPIFNPHSITKFLTDNPTDPQPFWAKIVKNERLLKYTIQKFSNTAFQFLLGKERIFSENRLKEELYRQDIIDGDDENELVKILFQFGYITMIKEGPISHMCVLRVVNEKVKHVLASSLQEKVNEGPLREMEDMLRKRDFKTFIDALDNTIAYFIADEYSYLTLEMQYKKIVSFLFQGKRWTLIDPEPAVWESPIKSRVNVRSKAADYIKILQDNGEEIDSKVPSYYFFSEEL